jgi:hypothetical protein
VNDAELTNMVLDALKTNSPYTIASLLRVSKPTVMRWAGGRNLPHAALRPALQKALSTLREGREP